MESTPPKAKKLQIALKAGEHLSVMQVRIAGLAAKGNADPDSDCNLPSVLEHTPDRISLMGELDDLLPRRCSFSMDIVALEPEYFIRFRSMQRSLAHEVRKRGVLLHERT